MITRIRKYFVRRKVKRLLDKIHRSLTDYEKSITEKGWAKLIKPPDLSKPPIEEMTLYGDKTYKCFDEKLGYGDRCINQCKYFKKIYK